MITRYRRIRRYGPATVAAAVVAFQAAPSPAQESIVVTGTRLPSVDVSAEPIAALDRAALALDGAVSLENVLARRPQFLPAIGERSALGNAGVASVDLRGLGGARTLVLVDGRRTVPFASGGLTDVNIVPPALIRRVELLTGGASAVYGSDAIAGVVNILLDRDFTGLRIDGASRMTTRGDGGVRELSVTAGLPMGGGGHITLSAGIAARDALAQGDRGFARTGLSSADLATPTGSQTTVPTAVTNSFVPGGPALYQIGAGDDLRPGFTPYNSQGPASLVVPQRRWNAMLLARQPLGDTVEADVRASYARSIVTIRSAATGTFNFPFTIRPDNPLLTAQQRDLLFGSAATLNPDGSRSLGVQRRLVELGDRAVRNDNRAWQAVGTVSGEIGAMRWEAFAQYGETHRAILFANDVSYRRTAQALDVVAGANGPVCRDPANGCLPVNLLTNAAVPPAALAFIRADGRERDRTSQLVAGAALSGEIATLRSPLADKAPSFALGAEYRRERAEAVPDRDYASGDLIGFGAGRAFPAAGYDVREAFAELAMPLAADRPYLQALALTLGYRRGEYSTAGGADAWKAAAHWAPVAGISLNAGWQRAVRAPNLFEIASPRTRGLGAVAADPCAGLAPLADSALAALCIATGAPQARIGTIAAPSQNLVNAFFGGNPALTPEWADTWTVGVRLAPDGLPGFSLALDHYAIRVSRAIGTFGLSAQTVVDGCYRVTRDADGAFCRAIARNPLDGSLGGGGDVGIRQYLANAARVETSGVDVRARGAVSLRATRVSAALDGTWVGYHRNQAVAFIAATDCAGRFGFACGQAPMPRWRHVASLDIARDKAAVRLGWRHLGPVRADGATRIRASRIAAQDYFDAVVTVDVGRGFTLRVGADNILDRGPPIVGASAGSPVYNAANSFPTLYDVLGTTVHLSVAARF